MFSIFSNLAININKMTAKVDKNCKIRSNLKKVDKCWQKLPKLETSAVYVMYQMHFLLKSHKDANILFNRTACQEIKLNIFQHFNCSSCEGSSPKRPPSYMFPRVFGDEFGDKFGDEFGDKFSEHPI